MSITRKIGGVRFRLNLEVHIPAKHGNHEVWLTSDFPTGHHNRDLLLALPPERLRDAEAFYDGARVLLETAAKKFE